jgi:hypothetical protein
MRLAHVPDGVSRRRLGKTSAAALCLILTGAVLAATPAHASRPPASPGPRPDPLPVRDRLDNPDAVLAAGWRTSSDLAWTTSGDATGLHVLVAEARSGYAWRTAATLTEPGFDVDEWIGNACLTGSGRRLVVVYAPRTFTNDADLFDRGGFTAVVDLRTGQVTKLPVLGSLAYFNPGCGTGETAVVAQYGGDRAGDPSPGRAQSRLLKIDAATGRISAPLLLNTEVTSAVPVGGDVIAAGGGHLVKIGDTGRIQPWVTANGVPFRLVPDVGGGVVFADRSGDRMRIRRAAPSAKAGRRPAVTTLAEGGRTGLGLARGAGGRVFVTGTATSKFTLSPGLQVLSTSDSSEISSTGAVALTRVRPADTADPRSRTALPDVPLAVSIDAKALATGRAMNFVVAPAVHAMGADPHPSLSATARRGTTGRAGVTASAEGADALGPSTDPVDETDERTCSVPRNDPRNQALQPKPRQVEWAVDQAITDSLTVVRPQNWKNLGMPEYTPQGLFPPMELSGGGRVPAQIMLAITAQESNMWQAAKYALPGVTANPLIGNFYGRDIYNDDPADDWDIDWSKADCGYGVTQVTDHMRLLGKEKGPGDEAWDYQKQRAVALDFATNVAAGLQILQEKWNETYDAGIRIHDADPSGLENWFFAVWAYNSGFHPYQGDDQPWGLGWGNNPINPRFDPQRGPFLEDTYDDARTPQRWPYPEKIMGWAGHPIELNESPEKMVAGYRAAWWTAVEDREAVKPPPDLFCDSTNQCYPGANIQPTDPGVADEPPGPCAHQNDAGQYDLRCWYHEPVGWKAPVGEHCNICGNEVLRFDPGWDYQADGTSFLPKCDVDDLPHDTLVIDDLEDDVPSIRPDCGHPWTNAGKFTLNFAADADGRYPSKVDFHQIGGGFGAHMWRAHTRTAGQEGGKLAVTGTWRLTQPIYGWTRIRVSVPDFSAWTEQADYHIDLGNGETRHRVVNQVWQEHRWIDLGVFHLAGNASVSLSNVTADGGEDSIIFDAVAFTPAGQPSAQYVAMGDGFASGAGLEPYDRNSDFTQTIGSDERSVACHRAQAGAYPQLVTLPGHSEPIAAEAAEGNASFALIACGGATTNSVSDAARNDPPTADDLNGHTDWGGPGRRYGEVAQVDQGYLDQDTTLVSITVGLNDARWGDVLHGCLFVNPLIGCYDEDSHLTRPSGAVDPEPLRDYEIQLLREWLPGHLRATYRDIHAKAPNAKIVVVGYPQVAPDDPGQFGCQGGLYPGTLHFLNAVYAELATATTKAVAAVRGEGADIAYIDATQHWRSGVAANEHWACSPFNGPDVWSNDILLESSSGSGVDAPGVGTFHPNDKGHRELAQLVNTLLQGHSSADTVKQRIMAYVASRSGEAWAITDAQAQAAADRCLQLSQLGGLVGDPCMSMPVFLPSVSDAAGAAQNDAASIDGNPPWVQQNYMNATEKGKVMPRDWYDQARIEQTSCPSPRPDGMQCDEFPFYTTELGGQWNTALGEGAANSARLSLVPKAENGREGTMLGAMFRVCAMTSATATMGEGAHIISKGSPFLTVPLLDPGNAPATLYVC